MNFAWKTKKSINLNNNLLSSNTMKNKIKPIMNTNSNKCITPIKKRNKSFVKNTKQKFSNSKKKEAILKIKSNKMNIK